MMHSGDLRMRHSHVASNAAAPTVTPLPVLDDARSKFSAVSVYRTTPCSGASCYQERDVPYGINVNRSTSSYKRRLVRPVLTEEGYALAATRQRSVRGSITTIARVRVATTSIAPTIDRPVLCNPTPNLDAGPLVAAMPVLTVSRLASRSRSAARELVAIRSPRAPLLGRSVSGRAPLACLGIKTIGAFASGQLLHRHLVR